jgi:hypothetical protein
VCVCVCVCVSLWGIVHVVMEVWKTRLGSIRRTFVAFNFRFFLFFVVLSKSEKSTFLTAGLHDRGILVRFPEIARYFPYAKLSALAQRVPSILSRTTGHTHNVGWGGKGVNAPPIYFFFSIQEYFLGGLLSWRGENKIWFWVTVGERGVYILRVG